MADELVRLLRGLLRAATPADALSRPAQPLPAPGLRGTGPDDEPASTFEALLQERLRALETDVAEVRSRVNGLLFLVLGAVLVQLLLRVLP